MKRKQELLNSLSDVTEEQFVGIYYLDKDMDLVHYNVYKFESLDALKDKIASLNDDLEDNLIRVLFWTKSNVEAYLTGVYDGITQMKQLLKKEVDG